MPSDFETNVLRVIAASASALVTLTIAREMYGKSYFALGVHEKGLVDDAAGRMVASRYTELTPDYLGRSGSSGSMGFQAPQAPAQTPPQNRRTDYVDPPPPPGTVPPSR